MNRISNQRHAVLVNKIGNLRGKKKNASQQCNVYRHITFCLSDVKEYAHMMWMMLVTKRSPRPKPSNMSLLYKS